MPKTASLDFSQRHLPEPLPCPSPDAAQFEAFWDRLGSFIRKTLTFEGIHKASQTQIQQTFQALCPSSLSQTASLPNESHLHRSIHAESFIPRYSIPDYVRLLRRGYRTCWAVQKEKGRDCVVPHRTMYGLLSEGAPQRRWNVAGVAKEQEWTVDLVEFARAVVACLLLKATVASNESIWYKGNRPLAFGFSHVEKVELDASRTRILNVGDLHGSAGVLINFLLQLALDNAVDDDWKIVDPHLHIVFTGDLVDRGYFGVEVWLMVLYLLIKNPSQVHVLKANHEYGAEREFRSVESVMKLNMPDYLYADVFYPLAESFPDMLFFTQTNGQRTDCWIYSHGALEIGYNPDGFLLDASTRFHHIQQYDRRWFVSHLITCNTEIAFKVQRFRNHKSGHCSPIWNYYHDGDDLAPGPSGAGISLNREVLEALLEAWNKTEINEHANRMQAGMLGRLFGSGHPNQRPNHQIRFRLNIGGHEHTNRPGLEFLSQSQRCGGVAKAWKIKENSHRQNWDSYPPSLSIASNSASCNRKIRSDSCQKELFSIDVDDINCTSPYGSSKSTDSDLSSSLSVSSAPLSSSSSLSQTHVSSPINENTPSYLVYKFFNMYDTLYFHFQTVSYGELAITLNGSEMTDSIRAETIRDIGIFYRERNTLLFGHDCLSSLGYPQY